MRPVPSSWTAVVNPAAGRGRTRSTLPRLVDALADADLDVAIHLSADADDLVAIARRAFDAGRGVVACGGDGTVSALAGVAAEHQGVLGVVAVGSGNDFARQLELPRRDVDAAVTVLETGHVADVDLGRVHTADGRAQCFTTVANTGFDAVANQWANGVTWTSGTPLYVLATLRTLMTYRPRRFRIVLDDEVVETEAWLVAVGNTRSYAGGMMITPAASVHDGRLDVCVVGPVARADFLRTFPSVFRGEHVRHPLVRTWRAACVSVEALDRGTPADMWASGERAGPLPARLEPAAGALAVMVPATRPT
ncbi:MAG: diacylglycerol kinase [Actinomycetota bacterium]|nr:diacylglycerol kinase [Actinomycetota bacterium]